MEANAPNRKLFFRNTFFQYLLQGAQYIFPLITIPYLTRVLGPDVYAVRAYVFAAMAFLQTIINYGFNTYGTRVIALAAAEGKSLNTPTSAIIFLRLLLCLVGVGILAISIPLIPILTQNPIYAAIAFVNICLTAMLPDFIFQGIEDMRIITQRYVASQVVAVACIFLFIKGPDQLLLVPTFETVATFIALTWSWIDIFFVRKVRITKVPFQELKRMFKSSTVYFMSNAADTVLSSLTTLLIGIYITSKADISYWSLAMMVVSAIQALYSPIANSLYPHMIKRRDFKLARKLLILGTITALIGTIAYACLSNVIMAIVGGPEYADGAYVITLTAPLLLFSYPVILMGFPILAAVGKIKQLTFTTIAAALFQIAGFLVLILTGRFEILYVALLRDLTEFVFMGLRFHFALPYLRSPKQDGTD